MKALTREQEEDVTNFVITNYLKNGLWRQFKPHEVWLYEQYMYLRDNITLYEDTTTKEVIHHERGANHIIRVGTVESMMSGTYSVPRVSYNTSLLPNTEKPPRYYIISIDEYIDYYKLQVNQKIRCIQ